MCYHIQFNFSSDYREPLWFHLWQMAQKDVTDLQGEAMECALVTDTIQGLVPISFFLGSLDCFISPVNS